MPGEGLEGGAGFGQTALLVPLCDRESCRLKGTHLFQGAGWHAAGHSGWNGFSQVKLAKKTKLLIKINCTSNK